MIWFESMEKSDYDSISKIPVTNTSTYQNSKVRSQSNSIECAELFGEDKYNSQLNYTTVTEHNLRSYLNLAKPIFNPIISKASTKLLNKFTVQYGGAPAIIKLMLESLGIVVEDAKAGKTRQVSASYLYSSILTCDIVRYKGLYYKKEELPAVDNAVTDLRFGAELLRDCLYQAADNIDSILAQKFNISSYGTAKEKYGGKKPSTVIKIKFLERVKNDYSVIESMFLKKLVIPPLSFRPTNPKRGFIHPLTKMIRDIILMNSNVIEQLQSKSVLFLFKQYNALCASVYSLLSEGSEDSSQVKSLIDTLGHKTGHIRSRMISHRVDYSGRSVIVVDPTLGVDECGIPISAIPKIYKYHITKIGGIKEYSKIRELEEGTALDNIKRKGTSRNVPVLLNRAPTLHRLSFLGFTPRPVEGNAIKLNPLVCPGYNADFDGDTMAMHVPLLDESIEEVEGLMFPSKLRYHPASGAPALVPRMEMVYGLNEATRKHLNRKTKAVIYSGYDDLKSKVSRLKIKIWDTTTFKGTPCQAGVALLCEILPDKKEYVDFVLTREIDKKSIVDLMKTVSKFNDQEFKLVINELTQIGFMLSEKYTPTCSILQEFTKTDRDKYEFCVDPFKEFNRDMDGITKQYEEGFITESNYSMIYSEGMDKVMKSAKANLPIVLGERNGYNRLVASGARGSESNLVQIYMCKGQITKSNNETFNVAITGSYSDQMSSLEHFASAYGARQGLIDKTQKTGDTGYIARLMTLVSSDCIVKNYDCHDTEGLELSDKSIMEIFGVESKETSDYKSKIASILEGRYASEDFIKNSNSRGRADRAEILEELERNDGLIHSMDLAYKIANSFSRYKIRSPITCRNSLCVKCYGKDLSQNREVKIGTPVGLVAGQAIGEPGTQLAMRTFQKGGAVGAGESVSRFNELKKYLMPEDPDGLVEAKGSVDKAQLYLALSAWGVYDGQADINFKHFEVLMSSLAIYQVLDNGGREEIECGNFYNKHTLGPIDGMELYPSIQGLRKVFINLSDPMKRIGIEDIKEGLSRSLLDGAKADVESSTLTRHMFGMTPNIGKVLNSRYLD
jgi:DNA-directed RNA polymerase beta' subunit